MTSSTSSRRSFLQKTFTAGAAAAALHPALSPALSAGRAIAPGTKADAPSSNPFDVKPFELEEITITELQEGMKSGKFTARSITEKYLARIDEIDKRGPA